MHMIQKKHSFDETDLGEGTYLNKRFQPVHQQEEPAGC